MSEAVSEVRTEAERLRRVEDAVLRLDTELPHLATKETVAEVRTAIENRLAALDGKIGKIETELPHLATKDGLSQAEIRLIKWIIGTGVAAVLVLSAQLWGAVQLLLRLSGGHG